MPEIVSADITIVDRCAGLAKDLFVELRKETLETQKLRMQLIGVKVTFVSAAAAAIIANIDKLPLATLAVPAFAATAFDFQIATYNHQIKRIGHYVRNHLEPILANGIPWPPEVPLWEAFMKTQTTAFTLNVIANFSFTLLIATVAIIAIIFEVHPRSQILLPLMARVALICALIASTLISLIAYINSRKVISRCRE